MPTCGGPLLAARLALILAAGGCATVFSSSDQSVSFSSGPPGAEVLIDGVPIGFTPVATRFDRDTFATRVVTLRRHGFHPRQFLLGKTLNKVAIFNLTCLPSWLTDGLTGGLIEYSPGAYHIELQPMVLPPPAGPGSAGRAADPDRDGLRFVLVNHRRIRGDIARGGGEHLRTLARLWGIERELPRMTSALGRAGRVLLARAHPYELYLEMRRVLVDRHIL
jgi:PEGA domain